MPKRLHEDKKWGKNVLLAVTIETVLRGKMAADSSGESKKAGTTGNVDVTKEVEVYSAYASAPPSKNELLRFRIYRPLAPTHSPRYYDLEDITYDGHFGTNFVLHFSHMNVAVRGKNLQEVVIALQEHKAEFIREYHPEIWAKPSEDAPIIQSIQIVIKEPYPSFDEQPGKKH